MKRLHIHVAVDDLSRSIGFYSTLFAAKPDDASKPVKAIPDGSCSGLTKPAVSWW